MKKIIMLVGALALVGCVSSKVEFNNPDEIYKIDIYKETIEDKQLVLNKNDEMTIDYDLEFSPDLSNTVGDVVVRVNYKGEERVQRFSHVVFIDEQGPVIEACDFPYLLLNSEIKVEDIVSVYDMLYKQEKLVYPKANYFAIFNTENSATQYWDSPYQKEYLEDNKDNNYHHRLGFIVEDEEGQLVENIDTSKLGKQSFNVTAVDQNGNFSKKTIEIEVVDEEKYNELKK